MARSKDGTSDDADGGSSDAFLREAARVDSASNGAVDDADADAAHAELAIGARFGRFVVREELGRGGMGIVYRAHDDGLGRSVALKVLPARRESDPRRRARFLREARAAASLTHANVATVYEIGEVEASLYIAMELIDGETLRARFTVGRPLPVDDVVRIAKGIVRGLAAAHARGIVHRDLKPENVMLDTTGEPKILDFGLAKWRASEETPREVLEHQPTDAASTEEGSLLGTPAYMSPEQAKGTPVDARSDLFSLGVVLYEALTGGRPFVGETSFATIAAVMRDEPAPLRRVNASVPSDLAAIVMRCLAKAPADRPASANALLASLEQVGQGGGASTLTLTRARAAIGVAVVLLLGVVALVAAARLRGNTSDAVTSALPSAAPSVVPSASAVAASIASTPGALPTSLPSAASVGSAATLTPSASSTSSTSPASSAPNAWRAPPAKSAKASPAPAPYASSAARPAASTPAKPDPLRDPD